MMAKQEKKAGKFLAWAALGLMAYRVIP